jgi:hypothetical protein
MHEYNDLLHIYLLITLCFIHGGHLQAINPGSMFNTNRSERSGQYKDLRRPFVNEQLPVEGFMVESCSNKEIYNTHG